MNFTEVAVGGIWVAAAINVAGYIVHSYSETYNTFPDPGGSGGGASDIPTIIPPIKRKNRPGPRAPAPPVTSPVPHRTPPPVPVIPPRSPRPKGSTQQPPGTITIPTPWGDIHIHPPHLPPLKFPSLPGLPGVPEIPVPVP